jgi:hypothetical protein
VVSATIIAFVPRRRPELAYLRPAASRSLPRPDDLTMDHVDTASFECVPTHDKPGHDLKNG